MPRVIMSRTFLAVTCVFVISELSVAGLVLATQPYVMGMTVSKDGGMTIESTLPLSVSDNVHSMDINVKIALPILHSTRYYLHPDDCLEMMQVNGREIQSSVLPFCDYQQARVVNLSAELQTGMNNVHLHVRNTGGSGGFDMGPAASDPLVRSLRFLAILLGAGYGICFIRLYKKKTEDRRLPFIVLGGALLRMLYVSVTPYQVRAYDWEGHLEYIFYVAQHWRIPPAIGGWEFHQPPLYYAISAIETTAGKALGLSFYGLLAMLQGTSLILSLLTLILAVWIAFLLFPVAKDRTKRQMLVAFFAFLPGIVFFASRINNDVLYLLWGTACFALLVRWWRHQSIVIWFVLGLCIALGLLSKNNTAVFLPVAIVCLLACRTLTLRRKAGLLGLLFLTVALVFGWLPVLRFAVERNTNASFVGNMQTLNGVFFIGNGLEHMLTFSPIRVILFPYNNTYTDIPQGRYFWEFLYRSAITSEFNLGPALEWISSLILLLGFILVVVASMGFWKIICKRAYKTLPCWLTLGSILAAHVALRLAYSSSTFQDFRYSAVATLPAGYFLVEGICNLSPALSRWARIVLILFCCLSLLLLLRLIAGAA